MQLLRAAPLALIVSASHAAAVGGVESSAKISSAEMNEIGKAAELKARSVRALGFCIFSSLHCIFFSLLCLAHDDRILACCLFLHHWRLLRKPQLVLAAFWLVLLELRRVLFARLRTSRTSAWLDVFS